MDDEPDQGTHNRAVDADELEVAAHLELDTAAGFVGVPALDGARDDVGHLALGLLDGIANDAFGPLIDGRSELRVGAELLTGLADGALESASQLGVGIVGGVENATGSKAC